jgi:two-component system response regulator
VRSRKRAILLVEDNPDDEELTLMTLESAGITNAIHVARDGSEALEYLFGESDEARDDLPMLVILDIKLPKVNGFEVLERVRAEEATRTLPVVILTSSDTDEDVARGYALGVNSYVRKPVEFADFSEAVRGLGLYWVLLNEPGGER